MAHQLEHLYKADAVTYSASDGYKVAWADDALTIPPEMISSSKVSPYEYDYGVEFYNARKDEANSIDGGRGLFGQSSWTAGGMVAAGWLRVNRVMGTRFVDHTQ